MRQWPAVRPCARPFFRAFADDYIMVRDYPGVAAVSGLIDVEKFYDSLDVVKLCDAALQCDVPPQAVALQLCVCLGPRVLVEKGCCSRFVFPTRSLVAGPNDGVDLSRCFLDSHLKRISDKFCSAHLGFHMGR